MVKPHLKYFFIVLAMFNFHLLFSQQEAQLKKIVEIHTELSQKGKIIDTVYTEYNKEGFEIIPQFYGVSRTCPVETVKIDTIKISQDTIWENQTKWICDTYQTELKIKYLDKDTSIILTIKADTVTYTEKEFKIGYKKTKLIRYSGINYLDYELIIDKSNLFQVKHVVKNWDKSIVSKLTNTQRYYHYNYEKQKWNLIFKTRKAKHRKRRIEYYSSGNRFSLNLFRIKSRTKYFYHKNGSLKMEKLYDSYSIKPNKIIKLFYENNRLKEKRYYYYDDKKPYKVVQYFYKYY